MEYPSGAQHFLSYIQLNVSSSTRAVSRPSQALCAIYSSWSVTILLIPQFCPHCQRTGL